MMSKCSVNIWNDLNSLYPSSWSTDNNRTNPTAITQRRLLHHLTRRPKVLPSTPWSWLALRPTWMLKIKIVWPTNTQHQKMNHTSIHCPKRSPILPPRLYPTLTFQTPRATAHPTRRNYSSISALTTMQSNALPSRTIIQPP